MRGIDTLVYLAVIAGIVYAVFFYGKDENPTLRPEPIVEVEPEIPPDLGSEIYVPLADEAVNSTGTAYAVADGVWVTARHVVNGCDQVGLILRETQGVLVTSKTEAENADVAVLRVDLDRTPVPVRFADAGLKTGQLAFHVGYPQGAPGEAASKLMGSETMVQRGRYLGRERVLAWAEASRTAGLQGSLAGISGGPAFLDDGAVIGPTVAEAPRRGRIYTAAPENVESTLVAAGAAAAADATVAPGPFSLENYGDEARLLRHDLRVAKVMCVVNR